MDSWRFGLNLWGDMGDQWTGRCSNFDTFAVVLVSPSYKIQWAIKGLCTSQCMRTQTLSCLARDAAAVWTSGVHFDLVVPADNRKKHLDLGWEDLDVLGDFFEAFDKILLSRGDDAYDAMDMLELLCLAEFFRRFEPLQINKVYGRSMDLKFRQALSDTGMQEEKIDEHVENVSKALGKAERAVELSELFGLNQALCYPRVDEQASFEKARKIMTQPDEAGGLPWGGRGGCHTPVGTFFVVILNVPKFFFGFKGLKFNPIV